MRIAFFVNDVTTEKEEFTTTRLAVAAAARGHEVYYMDAEHLSLDDRNGMDAGAFRVPDRVSDREAFLEGMRDEGSRTQVSLEDLDLLMLRNNPGDTEEMPWARDTASCSGGPRYPGG